MFASSKGSGVCTLECLLLNNAMHQNLLCWLLSSLFCILGGLTRIPGSDVVDDSEKPIKCLSRDTVLEGEHSNSC